MHKLLAVLLFFNSSFLYGQDIAPNPSFLNAQPVAESQVNGFLEARFQAVYKRFCTPSGKAKQNKFLKSILELRLADYKKSDPVSFKKLPPKSELFKSISDEVHRILRLDSICLDSTRKHENENDFSFPAATGAAAGLYYLQNAFVNTTIHEVGHLAFGKLFSEGATNGAEITIVKYDTVTRFFTELFKGEASFSGFINLLNPFETVDGAMGWISGHWTPALTGAGEAVGFTAAKSLMLIGGVLFTSISNILLIASGIKLRKTNPVLGYSLIFAGGFSYGIELVNWIALGVAGTASSDLMKMAAILGVSPFAITGIMVGVSAAILATYIAVQAYKSHKKKLQISAQDLMENGSLNFINVGKSNLSTSLYQNYKGKDVLDKSVEGLVTSIEDSMYDRVKHAVQVEIEDKRELEAKTKKLIADGKDPKSAKLGTGYKIKRWFSNIGSPIAFAKKKYRIHKYNKEKKKFYSYVGGSSMSVNYNEQGVFGKKAMINILQGEYAGGILKRTFNSGHYMSYDEVQERFSKAKKRVEENKGVLQVKDLVASNRQRLLYANVQSEREMSERWKRAFIKDLQDMKKDPNAKFTPLLKLRIGPSYSIFTGNNLRAFKRKMAKFNAAIRTNDNKTLTRMSKKYLKNRLKIREADISDKLVENFKKIWMTYASEVSSQSTLEYEPTGMLQVIDKRTCKIEIQFVCQVASTFFTQHGHNYNCPLLGGTCPELKKSNMLTSSDINVRSKELDAYFSTVESFYGE